jgi:hypothetical protein
VRIRGGAESVSEEKGRSERPEGQRGREKRMRIEEEWGRGRDGVYVYRNESSP